MALLYQRASLQMVSVSNQGKDPLSKDGDGFITETDRHGKIIKARFQKGILNTPKGLATIGDVLYVADLDRVVGFNINNGKAVLIRKVNVAEVPCVTVTEVKLFRAT